MKHETYFQIYTQAHNNAADLLEEAKILLDKKHYPRAYFLVFSALEEISKSQAAADVYTGFSREDRFNDLYRNHKEKLESIAWAHLDANEYPHNLIWLGPDLEDVQQITPSEPLWEKRQAALYVGIDNDTVTVPKESSSESDAREIVHICEVALKRIWEVTEYYGHQIGTKGFMK